MDWIDDELREVEGAVWQLFDGLVPRLDPSLSTDVAVDKLFQGGLAETLATLFIAQQRSRGSYSFLTSDQLLSIATVKGIRDAGHPERDIEEVAGLYVFIALAHSKVLKVGETDNLRRRVAKEHLGYGYGNDPCKVIDHFG